MMLKLHKIERDRRPVDSYADTDDVEEGAQQRPETTLARIGADSIRCYYARKDNRVGSRLTFKDGGGFAVTETPDMIDTMLEALGIRIGPVVSDPGAA